MYRRYTIHRDGDLLVEDLDASGKPIDPEPVPPEDRQPVEVTVMGPDSDEGRAALIDLLELAFGMEAEGPAKQQMVRVERNQVKPGPSKPGCGS